MNKKIAIIGMSFRFPGTNTASYWGDLLSGKDLVTTVDPTRWAQETYRHPDKNHPGTSYTFAAGSIGDVSTFDAAFFGISPREAAQIDPQQRLLLEMTWEAFENAGVRPSTVKGSKCGVFIGIASTDYAYRFADDLSVIDSAVGTGNTASIAANRISYTFDLRGPSMALDTACSSSMVAFHQACQSIQSGESTVALTGGVSLHLHPYVFIAFSKATMLSKRGKCSVFDAAGDGYVRSEGGGIFVLKDYEQAVRDGNPILAVVAASGINSDGKKSGLTVPSSAAQSALIIETYEKAGIAPDEVDYLEAHGTGTAVGDPIETHGLGEALGKLRSKDNPLLIGSVKSNMGHLEAASGVAGMVKALHCLIHREVPATIHLANPNPNIKFDEWNLRPVQANTALKKTGRLVVGINSFGFGGANAHVILESAPKVALGGRAKRSVPSVGVALPVVISGKNAAALKTAALDFAAYLRGQKKSDLYDIAYSTVFHRDWHEHRAVVFGHAPNAIAHEFSQFAQNLDADHPVEHGIALDSPRGASHNASHDNPSIKPAVAFIYSGNGSQWEGMGQRLLLEDATFKKAVQRVDQIFKHYADFSLENELAGKNGIDRYELTEIAQPALFALQVGITEMLRSRGVMPCAVAGHSVGEVAAAWASGALTLEQAVLVIFHRSRLQGKTKGRGQMTAVSCGEADIRTMLDANQLQQSISVAGINSARGVTVAGDAAALHQLELLLAAAKIAYKRLQLDYAFHSPAMDTIESGIHQTLASLSPREASIDYVSTVTGDAMRGVALNAEYWWHNIRQPVQFEGAIKHLQSHGVQLFVEVGPHVVLRGYINESLKDAKIEGKVIPTVLRGNDTADRVWGAASQVLIAGGLQDWKTLFPYPGQLVTLPNYSWQRETHWHQTTSEAINLLQRRKKHPLLGYKLSQHDMTWENQLDPVQTPMLADHVVGEAIVFPGAGFVECALAAAIEWQAAPSATTAGANVTTNEPKSATVVIEELDIRAPLLLSNENSKISRVAIDLADGGFTIKAKAAQSDEPWQLHATGRIPSVADAANSLTLLPDTHADAPPDRAPDFDLAIHLHLTGSVGLSYGPQFQVIESGWIEPRVVWAKLTMPAIVAADLPSYYVHPALLDSAFQLIIHLLKDDIAQHGKVAYLPTKIGRLIYQSGAGAPSIVKAALRQRSPHSLTADFTIFDALGKKIATLNAARFRSVRLAKDPADHVRLLRYRGHAKPRRFMSEAGQHAAAQDNAAPDQHNNIEQTLSNALWPSASSDNSLLVKRAHQFHLAYTEQVEPLLDVLCSAFAAEAIQQLVHLAKLDPNRFEVDALIKAAPVDAKATPLLRSLIKILVDDAYLVVDAAGGYAWQDEIHASAQDIWNTLLADYPDHFPVLNAVGRVGLNLTALLISTGAGGQTLEHVLPHECRLSTLYRHVVGADICRVISRAVQASARQALTCRSEGQRYRVIEISQGMPLFAADFARIDARDRIDYVFATTSTATAETCHRQFEFEPGITIIKISPNAEKDVGQLRERQSAALDGFDLAIITDDFSSEQEATQAIKYAKSALTSGGTLLFAALPPSRWLDFIWGADANWWQHTASGSQIGLQRTAASGQHRLASLGLQTISTYRYELKSGGRQKTTENSTNPTADAATDAGTTSSSPYMLVARADPSRSSESLSSAVQITEASTNASPTAPPWIVLLDAMVAPDDVRHAAIATNHIMADALVAELCKHGERAIAVALPSHEFASNVASDVKAEFVSQSTAIRGMLEQISDQHGAIKGVVNMAGFGLAASLASFDDHGAATLQAQISRCALTADLVRGFEQLNRQPHQQSPKQSPPVPLNATPCWLITQGAATALLPSSAQRMEALSDINNSADAPLWGFGRTLLNEAGVMSVKLLDVEKSTPPMVAAQALCREMLFDDGDQEIILTKAGERFVPRLQVEPRHLAAPATPEGACVAAPSVSSTIAAGRAASKAPTIRLGFQFPGQLRNLQWEATAPVAPQAHEIEIEVHATGLNFRDVMYALGLLSDEAVENGFSGPTLGLECAGVVSAVGDAVTDFAVGDPVVAFGASSFANRVCTSATAVAHIPNAISFEAAATIPSTFFTAYYALQHLAQLSEGERVLIHGAAGGVGIAAIQIAKLLGAEIYATAGSDEKRDFLKLLGVEHIYDSRSLAFADEILADTNGVGIDVVLNSLAGEAINRNFNVLKPFGRFLELGKRDFYENTKIGLRPFRNNISYFGIDADQLMRDRPDLTQRLFGEVMALFAERLLHPLPYQSFEANHVVDAFRYMQHAKHIGKIVVTYRDGISAIHLAPVGYAPLQLSANATYLVTGGLTGFGLKTAQRLVARGAKNLVLLSRSGPASLEAAAAIADFNLHGVQVHAVACDVTDWAALESVFNHIAVNMPPLRGIIHAAAVIEDGLIRNLDEAKIRRVFAPKIMGAHHLHQLSQSLSLDFFVLFSSATTLFGNPGQASYVAANTALESLAEVRRAMGQKALCVRWGAIADVGFLARNVEIRDALQSRMGGHALHSELALNMLEELLTSNRSGLGVMELDWRALSRFLPSALSPKFSELAAQGSDTDADEDHAGDMQRLLAELSPEELMATFMAMLKAEIGEILRIPIDKIDETRSIYDMGLDSLMGVELVLAIESRFGIRLPVLALSESPTIIKLTEKVIAQVKNMNAGTGTMNAATSTPISTVADQVQQVAAQHAAGVDIDADLVQKVARDIEANASATQSSTASAAAEDGAENKISTPKTSRMIH